MGLFKISPEVAEEMRIRDKVLNKGVSRQQLRETLKTDQMVALEAVRADWAADSRERTVKNVARIDTAMRRLQKANEGLQPTSDNSSKSSK